MTFGSNVDAHVAGHPALSPRELSVLQLAADGENIKSAAEQLGLSPRYIKNVRKHLIAKLGADNITHAVAQGLRRGLIQ